MQTAADNKIIAQPQVPAPFDQGQSSPAATPLSQILGNALDMLEMLAAAMPAGVGLRNAIEAECAAMRSAARADLAKASRDSQPEAERELKYHSGDPA